MKLKYLFRTRFGEILTEFLPPAHGKDAKVVILCPGAPSGPSYRPVVEFLARKGFWVFSMRYRGSWESGGTFMNRSPEKDVLEIVKQLPHGFKDLFGGKKYKLKPSAIYVFGLSFGGPAAILAVRDPRVTAAVAISSVIDWRVPAKEESIDWTARYVSEAFGGAYRGPRKNWMKLKTGTFYNPATQAARIDGSKLLLFHAKDDRIAPFRPAVKFAKATGASLALQRSGGHLKSSFIMKPTAWKKIARFLKKNS